MPDLKHWGAMSRELSAMPREFVGAANLMAHPAAGIAAWSALSLGMASHAFGVWAGAMTGAVEVSQRLAARGGLLAFGPSWDQNCDEEAVSCNEDKSVAVQARAAVKTALADAADAAGEVVKAGSKVRDAVLGGSPVVNQAPQALMPEDFRKPAGIDKPEAPDDLKAIAGIGPKLEQVLNRLGVWTFAQIAAWTPQEVAWVDDYLQFRGRIGRDDWLGQAAALAGSVKEKNSVGEEPN